MDETMRKAQILIERYDRRPTDLARAIGAMGSEVMTQANDRIASIMSVMSQAGSVDRDLEMLVQGSDLDRFDIRHRLASQTARLRLEREHLDALAQRIRAGSDLLTELESISPDPLVQAACQNRLNVFATMTLSITQTMTALDILLHL